MQIYTEIAKGIPWRSFMHPVFTIDDLGDLK
jgi:hypothetical protein